MAKSKSKKKPRPRKVKPRKVEPRKPTKKVKPRKVKPRKKRGVKVPSKEVIRPVKEEKKPVKKVKKERKKVEVIVPEVKIPVSRKRRGKKEEEPPTYDTSGGPRKKYLIVLEEETEMAFGLKAYRQDQYSSILMNKIVKLASKSDIKLSRKDVEKWMDKKCFDDGTDDKIPDAKIARPYDPSTKSYDRMRRRFLYTLEEKTVEKYRKSVKTHLYGCYLVNHMVREYLRGNLKLDWTKQDHADSLNWVFGEIPHGGDLILYEPGDPIAVPTHEWATEIEARRAKKEAEKAAKPKRKRTFACIYPGCKGRASKHVHAEDKTNIYYVCDTCKRSFVRSRPKPVEEEEDEE